MSNSQTCVRAHAAFLHARTLARAPVTMRLFMCSNALHIGEVVHACALDTFCMHYKRSRCIVVSKLTRACALKTSYMQCRRSRSPGASAARAASTSLRSRRQRLLRCPLTAPTCLTRRRAPRARGVSARHAQHLFQASYG